MRIDAAEMSLRDEFTFKELGSKTGLCNGVYPPKSGNNDGQVGNMVTMKITKGLRTAYYYSKDHLGSIRVTVNSQGAVAAYDDYYPFGEQMPGRNQTGSSDGRYKYTSKERDVETGLDYFGARYYDSWRAQWLSVDPLAKKYPGISPYVYVGDNPTAFIDLFGTDSLQASQENEAIHKAHTTYANRDVVCNECTVSAISTYAKEEGFSVPSELVGANGKALYANTMIKKMASSGNWTAISLSDALKLNGGKGMGWLIVAGWYNNSGHGHVDLVGNGATWDETFGKSDMVSIGDSQAGLERPWEVGGHLGWSFGKDAMPTLYLYTGFTPRGVAPFVMPTATVLGENQLTPAEIMPMTETNTSF